MSQHLILLSVTVPDRADVKRGDWETLSQRLQAIAPQTKGLVQLAENVWLLPRDEGMNFAAECMATARRLHLPAKAQFLLPDD